MASPEPQAPVVEQKPGSPPTSKEEKAGLNGLVAPIIADEVVAPKANGSATKSELGGPNGVATPATEKSSSPSINPKPALPEEPRSPPKSEDAPITTESEEKKTDAPQTEAKGSDVEMTDVASPPTAAAAAVEATAGNSESLPETASDSKAVETKPTESQGDTMAVDKQADAAVSPPKDGGNTSPAVATPSDSPVRDGDTGSSGLSHLAIDDKHQLNSPGLTETPSQGDVPMEDAPTSAKVSREREDDAAEEPSAKRAKTEPREDEVRVSTLPPETKRSIGLDGIENWNNKDLDARLVTPYRVKEFRHILSGIKKTKDGKNFKDAVIRMWPDIAPGYLAKIDEPVDLGELERGLREQVFRTLGDFKRKLSLLFKNAVVFNGETHYITRAGLHVVEAVWTKCLAVPAEEPPRDASKSKNKQMPSRRHEQRAAHARPPARPTARSPPAPASERSGLKQANRRVSSTAGSPIDGNDSQTFAVPPGGVPQIRRASTNLDGSRPKRAIHPPRSKDIDYSNKAAPKRHLKPEIQFCDEVLREMMDPKNFLLNSAFLEPVDPVALGIPTYFSVIKKPMDLSQIQAKLSRGEYTIAKQFYGDLDLMFNNCFKFNGFDTPVGDQGKRLKSFFHSEWRKKDPWLAKHAASKPASIDSDGSEDESDAEPEVAAAGGGDSALITMTIATLQDKLQEETTKLNNLYLEELPNEALIKLQSTVLSTVQQSLLAEKQKLASLKSERPPSTKARKPPKGKSAGAGASRKAGGSGAAKKGGMAKKAPKKERPLGAAERNQIIGVLGDDTFLGMDQAIHIIKKDTGTAENDSGELELDMEQLSNNAVQKLWDLCCKVVPGFGRSHVNDAAPEGSSPSATGPGAKQRRKNKPMNAREQEERINHLTRVQQKFREGAHGGQGGGSPGATGSIHAATTPTAMQDDSSEESEDSEEE